MPVLLVVGTALPTVGGHRADVVKDNLGSCRSLSVSGSAREVLRVDREDDRAGCIMVFGSGTLS